MGGLPARCWGCGHTWVDTFFSLEGVSQAVFQNTSINCPRCGGWAKIADGTFNFEQPGPPKIIAAPPQTHALFRTLYDTLRHGELSRESIEQLSNLARDRQSGRVDAGEAEAKAAAIAPNLSVLFSSNAVAWYGLLVALLTLYLACTWHEDDDVQMQALLESQLREEAVAEEQLEATREMLTEIRKLAERQHTTAEQSTPAKPAPDKVDPTRASRRRAQRAARKASRRRR